MLDENKPHSSNERKNSINILQHYEDVDLLNSIPYPDDVNDNLDTEFINVKNIINDISTDFMLKQQEERDKIIELYEKNTIKIETLILKIYDLSKKKSTFAGLQYVCEILTQLYQFIF